MSAKRQIFDLLTGTEEELVEFSLRPVTLTVPLLELMAVHGAVALALKHPLNNGTSTFLQIHFLDTAERLMEEAGLAEPPEGWRGIL